MASDWWLSTIFHVSPVLACSWIVWVILSICLHELGHGWMAIRCGDNTPRALGHMTLNPFVHIPWPWAWIMFGLFGFTWGLMPVSPYQFRGRYDDAKVSLAGPLVNALLAIFCIVLSIAWLALKTHFAPNVAGNVAVFLWIGVVINLVGVLFNLIPVPPLDGSSILANFSVRYREFIRSENGQMASMLGFILIFTVLGMKIWNWAFELSDTLLNAAARVTGQEWPGNPLLSISL